MDVYNKFPYVMIELLHYISYIGIDGLGDTRLICGIIVARKKAKQEKEGKVSSHKKLIIICNLYWIINFI